MSAVQGKNQLVRFSAKVAQSPIWATCGYCGQQTFTDRICTLCNQPTVPKVEISATAWVNPTARDSIVQKYHQVVDNVESGGILQKYDPSVQNEETKNEPPVVEGVSFGAGNWKEVTVKKHYLKKGTKMYTCRLPDGKRAETAARGWHQCSLLLSGVHEEAHAYVDTLDGKYFYAWSLEVEERKNKKH